MPKRSYSSFEEWGRQERDKRLRAATERAPSSLPGTAGGHLRFEAAVAADAGPSAAHQCRAVALEWAQRTLGGDLPRKAWRHRPFSARTEAAAVRAVRLRDGVRDHWALQVVRNPGPDHEVATEVVVALAEGGSQSVGVAVRDRSVVPRDAVSEYPADMLAVLAGRVPLLQGGRRLSPRPIVVESDETMNAFIKMLVDPGRDVPFAVASVPPGDEERDALEAQWDSLARSLIGLAIVWVLPPAMTYQLSDTVSKPLSVFLGAWRFYRPGFRPGANRSDHPLVLKTRMTDERAVQAVARNFLRMAAEERMRADRGAHALPDYDAVAAEAASVVRGPARLVSFLRQAFAPSPTVVREPPAPALAEPAAVPSAPPEAAAPETPLLRRKLRAARETARVRASRYEQARERAEAAERERDEALRRAEQLAGLVRSMGGNPDADVPFPTEWDEFGAWCDEHLAGRLALAAPAKRELARAEFRDVDLAARCLGWLAGEYREGRLEGGNPRLHGRIDAISEGVFNVPCGGDAFEFSWEGRSCTADWHIKGGANARDPRRCLRIYYCWDEGSRQVVVASMPAHRRTALS